MQVIRDKVGTQSQVSRQSFSHQCVLPSWGQVCRQTPLESHWGAELRYWDTKVISLVEGWRLRPRISQVTGTKFQTHVSLKDMSTADWVITDNLCIRERLDSSAYSLFESTSPSSESRSVWKEGNELIDGMSMEGWPFALPHPTPLFQPQPLTGKGA